MQDLSKLYSAFAQNSIAELSPAPLFSEYANKQFEYCHNKEYDRVHDFWLKQFKDSVPVMHLPIDFARPAVRTYNSRRMDYELDKDVVSAFRKLSTDAGFSFMLTFLAAFELLLHRLTGQDQIVIGLPVYDHSFTGNERLVGHCVNLLPLKSAIKPGISFMSCLKNCRQFVAGAVEHRQIAFGNLLGELNISSEPLPVPFMPVVFNIDMEIYSGVDFYGLDHKLDSNPKAFENFDLFINVSGSGKVEWSYNPDLFKAQTIHRMMTSLEKLLRSIINDPYAIVKFSTNSITW